eukprot:m.200566 g.200566  ORF g.200566 m.200566 type:complete len:1108 (+) comp14961_c0_seq1:248-3571(+)
MASSDSHNPIFFSREVTLDLPDTGKNGFELTAAGAPPFHRHASGCFVRAVVDGGVADEAMLLTGDYLISVNGTDVTGSDVAEVRPMFQPGQTVTCVVECCAVFSLQTTSTELVKVRDNRAIKRVFYMNELGTRILWNSKSRGSPSIRTTAIKEVRKGRETAAFESAYEHANAKTKAKMGGPDATNCFSLIYGESFEVNNLVAYDRNTFKLWVLALEYFVHVNRNFGLDVVKVDEASQRELWLKDIFEQADLNGDRQLSKKEVKFLLKRLNVYMSDKDLDRRFRQADRQAKGRQGHGYLDFAEFVQFYKLLTLRPDVGLVMTKYGTAHQDRTLTSVSKQIDTFDDVTMSAEQLQYFCSSSQLEERSLDECAALIAELEPVRKDGQFSIDGFTRFLFGHYGQAYDIEKKQNIYQDMTQPLSRYWFASSHNTYLTDDQLYGYSDVEAYKRACLSGCRCVELDCWDGDESFDHQPIVFHGHTLTSKILLRDALEACAEYAFVASEYPFILSIENHLSVEQQRIMARDIIEIFGDKLYVVDPAVAELPSPEELKNKVLVKGKRLPLNSEEDEVSDEDEALDEFVEKKAALKRKPPKAVRAKLKKEREKAKNGKKKVKLAREFSDIVSLASVHFKEAQLDTPDTNPAYQMSSFGEGKAKKLVSDPDLAGRYMKRNIRQLARVYPAGYRVDSSNYNPVEMWCAGCQLVALNYQTPDTENALNLGKFADNGGCGYILKPPLLNSLDSTFNPGVPSSVPAEMHQTLTVRILSGQSMPKPHRAGHDTHRGEVVDPYVQVTVHGMKGDNNQARTTTVNDNGLNPIWGTDKDILEFDVSFPALALVEFNVYDEDFLIGDDFIAQAVIPLEALKPGYRQVQLCTRSNNPIPNCTLFIDVTKSSQERSLARKGSKMVAKTTKLDPTQRYQKTRIPELDHAFETAPRLTVQTNYNRLLAAIENLKEVLGLHALDQNSLVPDWISRVESKAGVTSTAVVSGRQGSLNVTLVAPDPCPADLAPLFSAFDRLSLVTAQVYRDYIKCMPQLERTQAQFQRHSQDEALFNSVCDTCRVKGKKRFEAKHAVKNNLVKLQSSISILNKSVETANTLMSLVYASKTEQHE